MNIAVIAIAFEISYLLNSFKCKFFSTTKYFFDYEKKAKIINENPIRPFDVKICT